MPGPQWYSRDPRQQGVSVPYDAQVNAQLERSYEAVCAGLPARPVTFRLSNGIEATISVDADGTGKQTTGGGSRPVYRGVAQSQPAKGQGNAGAAAAQAAAANQPPPAVAGQAAAAGGPGQAAAQPPLPPPPPQHPPPNQFVDVQPPLGGNAPFGGDGALPWGIQPLGFAANAAAARVEWGINIQPLGGSAAVPTVAPTAQLTVAAATVQKMSPAEVEILFSHLGTCSSSPESANYVIQRIPVLDLNSTINRFKVTMLYEVVRQRALNGPSHGINTEVLEMLLRCGADPNLPCPGHGSSPMHGVIQGFADFLVELGRRAAGDNVLVELKRREANCRAAIELLVNFGANVFATNFGGESPCGDAVHHFRTWNTKGKAAFATSILSLVDFVGAEVSVVRAAPCGPWPPTYQPLSTFIKDDLLPPAMFLRGDGSSVISQDFALLIVDRVMSADTGVLHLVNRDSLAMSFPRAENMLNVYCNGVYLELQIRAWPKSFRIFCSKWEMLPRRLDNGEYAEWQEVHPSLREALENERDSFADGNGTMYHIGRADFTVHSADESRDHPLDGAICRWVSNSEIKPEDVEFDVVEMMEHQVEMEDNMAKVNAIPEEEPEPVPTPVAGPAAAAAAAAVVADPGDRIVLPVAGGGQNNNNAAVAAVAEGAGRRAEEATPPPPVKRSIDLHFPKTGFLYDEYLRLVATLPRVLKLELLEDFEWNDEMHLLRITGTDEQLAMATAVGNAIEQTNANIRCRLRELETVIGRRQKETLAAVRKNNVKLLPQDRIRGFCATYCNMVRKHFSTVYQNCDTEMRNQLKKELCGFMKQCIHDPSNAMNTVDAIALRIQRDVVSACEVSIGPDAKIEVLQQYFTECEPKFDASMKTFRDHFLLFRESLLRRARRPDGFVLPILLRDYDIHCVCVMRKLPFYIDTARLVLEAVEKNDVTVVKTGTGSGKSSLMPLLLLAAGIPGITKIAVTQPRRFAAESIADNLSKAHGDELIGYAMAGNMKNVKNASIVYITDGLLRHTIHPDKECMYDTIIIDEVHERSKEIDGCVALLAAVKQTGKVRMPKVILSSATFDPTIESPFKRVKASVFEVEAASEKRFERREHYPDKPCPNARCHACAALKWSTYYLQVVADLFTRLVDSEQLLLFLPSRLDVESAVAKLQEWRIPAMPLHAAMHGRKQLETVATGRVFVSTNIAETSLTFPHLRYVVDLGKVQRPRLTEHGTLMEVVDAPKSTISQRLGRVGRTCHGDYVALYKSTTPRAEHIDPKLELEGEEDFLFSLQKQLNRSITLFLPRTKNDAVTLPKLDDAFGLYPVIGTAAMSRAFHESRRPEFASEYNILCLAAIRKVMSAKMVQELAKECANLFAQPGDITGLMAMMLRFVSSFEPKMRKTEKPAKIEEARQAAAAWANGKGLGSYLSFLDRALRDAVNMIETMRTNFGYEPRKQNPAHHAQLLGPLLLTHRRGVFFSLKKFGGAADYYTRALDCGDLGDDDVDSVTLRTISSFHSKSSQSKAKPPPTCVLALEFMLFGAEMPNVRNPFRLGVMQLVEPIPEGDATLGFLTIKRRFALFDGEEARLPGRNVLTMRDGKNLYQYIVVQGQAHKVLEEMGEIQKLLDEKERVVEVKSVVQLRAAPDQPLDVLQRQFDDVVKKLSAARQETFLQMKRFWKNQCGLEIEVKLGQAKPAFVLKGRVGQCDRLAKQIGFWLMQLSQTPAMHFKEHFSTFTSFIRPRELADDAPFRARLRFVTTESGVTDVDVWNKTVGPSASRETRMEVVARIAILKHHCRISGGFVRDWIVGGVKKHPAALPDPNNLMDNAWIGPTENMHLTLDMKEVIPKDIDAELPWDQYFDPNRFIQEVRDAGVNVDFYEHVAQRHVFVFDLATGPFMLDMVEYHFAAIHGQADFDCNMLTLMHPCEGLIGLKIESPKLTVDGIIDDILRKRLHILSPQRSRLLIERKKKMADRGWDIVDDPDWHYIGGHENPDTRFLQIFPGDSDEVKGWFAQIALFADKDSITAYQLENATLQKIYEGKRDWIKAQNPDKEANERLLWHGTRDDAVKGILKFGFDMRWWNGKRGAAFGRAAYFGAEAKMSNDFADNGPGKVRYLLLCTVALGKCEPIQPGNVDYIPKPPYTSAVGRESHWHPDVDQLMIYSDSQAAPKYLFRYTVTKK